jgi:histidinol-phosphate/aromatic aminotransferase/cobyric acid decarboxylase-like protein
MTRGCTRAGGKGPGLSERGKVFAAFAANVPRSPERVRALQSGVPALDSFPFEVWSKDGAQMAFDLIARVLLDPGDTAWMEEPGYLGARAALVASGARVKPFFAI